MISVLQPDQQVSDISAEANSFELRRCPFHPNYNVEVYCAKENLDPSVMCIKCYLDPDVSKRLRGESLIAIRDLILKSIQIDSTQGALFLESKAEILEQKYFEMSARDHVGTFKRHAEIQIRKLDAEIERLKHSLDDLKEKFIQFFAKQAKTLENKQEEIERKIYHFLLEKEELEKKSFGTLEGLLRELNAIEDFAQYERFVRLLYKKSQFDAEGSEGTSLKNIIDMIDNKGALLTNMKSMKIDTGILEEMRARIDSIEVLDKATALPGIGNLDPQSERTLDKIRKLDSKSTPSKLTPYKQTQPEAREGSNKPSPQKEKESPSFSKLLEVLREKKSATTSPYKGKTTTNQKSQMHLETSRDRSSQKQSNLAEILTEKHGNSPYRGGNDKKVTMDIESESKRDLFGNEEHKDVSLEERISFGLAKGKSLLENLREKYDPYGVHKPASTQKSETTKAPPKKQKSLEKAATSKRYNPEQIQLEDEDNKEAPEHTFGWHQTENLHSAVPSTMPIDDHKFDSAHGLPKEKGHENSEKGQEDSIKNLTGTLVLDPTLDFNPEQNKHKSQKNLATPPIELEYEGDRNKETGPHHGHDARDNIEPSSENPKNDATRHIVIESESSDENKSHPETKEKASKNESRSPSIQESSRENIVQQWIDQKLSGFVVFQNTLRTQHPEKTEDFNKYSSQSWIQLSRSEKDEYTTLALSKREQLKAEFRELCRDIEDLSELQETLDQKIKKLKK